MATTDDPNQPRLSGSSRLLPSVLLSNYSTYRPQAFQPTCTHLTMTRIYDKEFDREPLIEDAIRKSHPVSFDLLGVSLSVMLSPGPRSAERRSDKLNFLTETPLDQLNNYTPGQVVTILRQREHLLEVLHREQMTANQKLLPYYLPSPGISRFIEPPPGSRYPANEKPWVPRENAECQAKYCHRCRPSCALRTYLSLNAILNDEIPPSAATGFGFHRMGTRPVVDVEVIRYIGLRPVPWPKAGPSTVPSSPSSDGSDWTFTDVTDVIEPHLVGAAGIERDSTPTPGETPSIDSIICTPPRHDVPDKIRPAWSPPPTPSAWVGSRLHKSGMTTFEHHPPVYDGRSPASLRTNEQVRNQVLSSIECKELQPTCDTKELQSISSHAPSGKATFIRALLTPLPAPTSEENFCLRDDVTSMMLEEMEERHFHQEPLEVGDHGVAVLEESLGLGVPDVISQV
ncbi:Uu.00g005140.m01.CDS01 [Anthostomella pinea]|uniref:Uu.00g005140.m01.CDS01 n=1 Tax=Anthostomella pinea TaxID=933095 RepID=A0AAI8VK04_9PEZI|nr:Uu.00g005140.m01.CDS01 [Anthostomella pinea]